MEFNRSSSEYRRAVFAQAAEAGSVLVGLTADRPPETYDELSALVSAKRNPDCGISVEIDEFMEALALATDRDELSRQLPYIDTLQSLIFIVPDMQRIREELKETE